jgi:hypothetical protein
VGDVRRIVEKDFGMQMHTRVKAHPNRSPDRLGHLPLVDRSQTCVLAVLDASMGCYVLADHCEVLAARR